MVKVKKPNIPKLRQLGDVTGGQVVSCAEYPGELLLVSKRQEDADTLDQNTWILSNLETGEFRELSVNTTVILLENPELSFSNSTLSITSTTKEVEESSDILQKFQESHRPFLESKLTQIRGRWWSKFQYVHFANVSVQLLRNRKLQAIKYVKEVTLLRLKESKDLVEYIQQVRNLSPGAVLDLEKIATI
ncbi:MAG: hypothetical protein VKJ04_04275 [Vampirovibrionales bacterium]|nr:hypothetical protein [Vampirovibrionales bacterium]